MAIDLSTLRQSDYWKKKIRRVAEVRDANKDGYISRADYELMLDRCKKLDIATPHFIETCTSMVQRICYHLGLTDESVKLSYDEYEEKLLGVFMKERNVFEKTFREEFHSLDIDRDGFISFEEWIAHYKIFDIDTAHARASFDAMDTNHDQKISEDEFVEYNCEFYLSTENKLNSAILFGPLE